MEPLWRMRHCPPRNAASGRLLLPRSVRSHPRSLPRPDCCLSDAPFCLGAAGLTPLPVPQVPTPACPRGPGGTHVRVGTPPAHQPPRRWLWPSRGKAVQKRYAYRGLAEGPRIPNPLTWAVQQMGMCQTDTGSFLKCAARLQHGCRAWAKGSMYCLRQNGSAQVNPRTCLKQTKADSSSQWFNLIHRPAAAAHPGSRERSGKIADEAAPSAPIGARWEDLLGGVGRGGALSIL